MSGVEPVKQRYRPADHTEDQEEERESREDLESNNDDAHPLEPYSQLLMVDTHE